MQQYLPITLDRLLGPDGREQLETALTDHAIAHQGDSVVTDAKGYVCTKVIVQVEMVTDTRTGHIRGEVAIRGGLVKLQSLVRPMTMQDGVLLIEAWEEDPQVRPTELQDPGQAEREALRAERRRERALDVERGRRGRVDADDPEGEPGTAEPDDDDDVHARPPIDLQGRRSAQA